MAGHRRFGALHNHRNSSAVRAGPGERAEVRDIAGDNGRTATGNRGVGHNRIPKIAHLKRTGLQERLLAEFGSLKGGQTPGQDDGPSEPPGLQIGDFAGQTRMAYGCSGALSLRQRDRRPRKGIAGMKRFRSRLVTGILVLVPLQQVVVTRISVEDGIKMVVSGGILSPGVLTKLK